MDEILTIEDHQIIQNEIYDTKILPELPIIAQSELQSYYNSLKGLLEELKIAIKEKQIIITPKERIINGNAITVNNYTTTNQDIQAIFIKATQKLYELRQLITGEEIYLLENLNGEETVISQKGWLQKITANSGAINLLESSIKSIENEHKTSLLNSSIFSDLTKEIKVEKNLIQDAGSLYYESKYKKLVDKEMQLYKKTERDTQVYAYWRTEAHKVHLFWGENKIPYNYGELYETAISRAEQVAQLNDNSIIQKFKSLLNGQNPLEAIFGTLGVFNAYKKNSTPGLKEGDFRTAQGQWVQAKRGNQQIITFTQIYNNLNKVVTVLSKLCNSDNFIKKDESLKANIISQFVNLYYSNKKIDKKIKDRLKQLPLLKEIN